MAVHITAAGVQQEKYLLLEKNFDDHQRQQDGSVQSGFSIGRRIKFRDGHNLDLGCMKKAIGSVLQRSAILQCTLQEKKNDHPLPAPTCEMICPPYSTKYCMVRPEWDDTHVEKFLHFEEVEASCSDLTVPCTAWLMRPFPFDERTPLFRFVVLRRGTHIEELLLVGHRSIVDAWSIEWIVSELVQTYEQLLSPQGAGLLRLVNQMVNEDEPEPKNFDTSESDEFRNAVSYWATHLSDAMPVVQVPVDRPRPQLVSMKQARYSYIMHGSTLTAKHLRRIAMGCEYGIHNILVSVFISWLTRMTAEKDVVIGLLTNLRREGYDATVGPLTNRIPLRTDLTTADDAPLSFREVLQRVSKSLHEVMQHKHVEFEQVIESPLMQETLKGTKTTLLGGTMQDQDADALSPLFKVMYMMDSQLTPPSKRDAAWSTVENLAVVGKALAPYDLTLRVNNRWDGGVEFVFLYNAQLFTKPFIGELMNNYTFMLKQVVEKPTQGIYDYSLITPKAKAILPDPTLPQDEGWPGALVHVFHKNAQRHPEQLAVSYESNVTLSYSQLDAATSRFAHALLEKGIKKGDVIGLYGYRSPAVVVAIMGIYKAGAAYSMMDPQYPDERVVTCMKIAGIVGWVRISEAPVEGDVVDAYIKEINPKVRLTLPEPETPKFNEIFGAYPATLPEVLIEQDDTAVVTFTSGSTGIPKGVMGRQSSLTTFYPWLGATFDITDNDRFGMCSGIAHDPLQRDIFTPLFFGAAVFIPTQDTINTPGCLGRYMKAQGITVCCFTPALGQILVTVDEADFTMNDLRFVMFVGDMLIKRDVLRLRGLAPNCRIINMWGTTETSRAVGYFDLPPPSAGGTDEFISELKEVIPCGKGMKDCQMLLLNPAGRPAGVGEAAEIHMRSCHLAKGYLGLPKDTAAKFIRSPFTANPRDMLYKSGDLGHYLADGTVECLGRVDDQVKIRGFRIELGEINAKLSRHEKAKENVTVVRKDSKDEKIIVSYVVPVPAALAHANKSPECSRDLANEYREFLKSKVPHYMVPTAIVILQKMPLTPNAKINHRALPDPPKSEEQDDIVIEGLTEAEEKVLAIWKKHLSHAVRSTGDNFFDLGGHSLSATVVTMEVNKQFGVKLPLNALFASPTLAGMATAVRDTNAGSSIERDFTFEAQLPSEIKRADGAVDPPEKPRGVFITGTPGFLATFIVIDLLRRTDGPIYCLIRAPRGQGAIDAAKQRMVRMLKACLGWKDEYDSRIIPCLGDLSLPKLGLSTERWAELVDRVDLVVHSGAVVHWLYPYEKMKAANVDGTLEVLRLCCEGARLKVLAFISTTNVYEAEYPKYDIIKEDVELTTGRGLTGGYTQSKWVADKMVMEAAKVRGIPAMCLRPSFISGASDTGAWTTDDFLVRLMKGCVQLKSYPMVEESKGIDMSPVDWMAAASVTVLMKKECRGKHYNLVNANPVPYAAVFRMFKSLGYEMEELPYPEWRAKLLAASETGENALSAVASHFTEGWATGLRPGQVHDSSELLKAIDGAPNSVFPDMNKAMEQAACYLIGSGFLEPPPGGLQLKSNAPWEDLFSRGEIDLITRAKRTN